MDILDARVPEGFNIVPKYIRKQKYMYIVHTDKGTYVIRKTDVSEERIVFCDNIKTMMRRKGYRLFDNFEISVTGEPYFRLDDTYYIMTAASREAPGPDYGNTYDFRQIIRGFAAFHKAAAFGSCSEYSDFYGENTIEKFKAGGGRLKRLRRLVYRKKRLDDIDYTFLKNFEYYYRLAEEAAEGLEKYDFYREEKRAEEEGRIAVNNADEETMFLYPGGLYMTELLKLSVSSQLEDLRLIINRYLKKNPNPQLTAGDIIKEYSSRNRISERQIVLLYYLLLFPERYIKTFSVYYQKGHAFTPVYVKEAVKKTVDDKERHLSYISELIK
ncbi:MAG: hypothetical protein LUD81_09585 [Clostridiales bacterium]|nr:hypothetical protein [Clostridiales bacterium]